MLIKALQGQLTTQSIFFFKMREMKIFAILQAGQSRSFRSSFISRA